MANVVKIDLDQIWNPIGVGIRRAYVFAGFGINAANDPKQVDYHLPGLMKLSFAPQSVGDDLLGEYKREFANWILGNALREVIESLEMCLENVFQVCTLAAQSKGKSPSRKVARDFNRSGASGQLKALASEFGLHSRHASFIESLNLLRNCLTHRRGTVAKRDCNDPTGQHLKVNYLRFQFEQQCASGENVVISPDTIEPLLFKESGYLNARVVETEKSFPVGSLVLLRNPDIRDVLFTCWNAGIELRSELIGYLKGQGIPVDEEAG